MDNKNYKTYKFGKLIISKINNEISLLYKGKRRVHSKIFYMGNSILKQFKLINSISIIILILALSFYIFINIDFSSKEDDYIDKDDEEKNELLLSSQTDYSEQVDEEALQIRDYTIQKGDTLSEIAKEFGVSMDTICGSNNLNSYDYIRLGKKLKIPNKDGILHKVKKGQNIADIAKKYKVDIDKIFSQNNIKNYDFISVEDLVFIPDAKPLNIIPGFLWPAPTKRITSAYGWRRHPINKRRHFHNGLDIRCKYQAIRATKFGQVKHTGWMGRYGKTIIIAHPGGWKSLYGHLSKIYVKKGQRVKQGQFIGKSGNTGYSTGPHLHFELIKNGKHQNPYKYLHYRK
ncbi:MAG: M23 family metallopeptidase [Spirochaetes bacterium]|nr:M23 family metallopeptidase [Spirochaetota bacterium]